MKKDLKVILKNILVISVILVFYELFMYSTLHHTLKGLSIFNILFMIPVATVLTAFTGFNEKINSIILIVITFLISLFYVIIYIYYGTFGSIPSISMAGVGGDAVTNFSWSIVATIKDNIISILVLELPTIVLILEAIFNKKLNDSYTLFEHPIVLVVGVLLWYIVVFSLALGGTADYTPYGAYHSRFIDTDTASKRLGVMPNALIETRYAIFGSNKQQLIEIEPKSEEEEPIEIVEDVIEYNEYPNLDFATLNSEDANIENILDYLNTQTPSNKNE